MEHRNTMPGYELEHAEAIPDEEDNGVGLSAGERVSIVEDHFVYGGEEGVVQAVARGTGMYEGSIVVDVLVDGTDAPERFTPDEVEAA